MLKLVILGHFSPFTLLKITTIQSHDVWFLRYGVRQTEFFVILGRFLLFYHPPSPLSPPPPSPPMDPENQNFEKMKETPEDIIILQTYTINDSHMMHGS